MSGDISLPLITSQTANSNSQHFVNISIGSTATQALIDSGASISCVSQKFISTIKDNLLQFGPSKFKLAIGVGGETHRIDSSVTFHFTLAGKCFQHTFHVLPGHHPVILGLDWLTLSQSQVHFGTHSKLVVDNLHVPLVGKNLHATVKNTTRVPAQSVCFLHVNVPNDVPLNQPLLFEGLDMSQVSPHVHITDGIDEMSSHRTGRCRVVNNSKFPVVLPAGLKLAQIQHVDSSQMVDLDSSEGAAFISSITDQLSSSAEPTVLNDNISFNVSQALSPEQKQKLLSLLFKNRKAFAANVSELGKTDLVTHTIDTGDAKPIFQRSYRQSPSNREKLDDIINEMLAHGLIEPSTSKWSSPCLLVDKSDGSKRIVIDFRKLNKVCIPSTYPMPTLETIWDAIGDSKPTIFSTMDLWSGFHQIPLSEESKEKTAFSTMDRHFQYCVLPMGLSKSPITFQQLMVQVLRGLQFRCTIVYCDDIIVFSQSFSQHLEHLQLVFDRLKEAKLTLKPSKCQFAVTSVKYLGHIMSPSGVTPNPEKTAVIDNFPRPKTVKHVRRFTGMTNYYRKFIPNYAKIVAPLILLLHKNTKFQWNDDCEQAFVTLKKHLVSDPILRYPDHNKHFYLTTDASKHGLSFILGQKDDKNRHYVCFYGARSLRPAEKNYSATDLEALAVVTGVDRYHTYLIDKPFTILTDHKALKHMLESKFQGANGKLARWAHALMSYKYKVEYLEGASNTSADCLSRLPDNMPALSSLSVADLHSLSTTETSNSKHVSGNMQYHLSWNKDTLSVPFVNAGLHIPSVASLSDINPSGSEDPTADHPSVEIDLKHLPTAQQECPEIGDIYRYKALGKLPSDSNKNQRVVAERDCYAVVEDILYHFPRQTKLSPSPAKQIVIPTQFRQTLLEQFHDSIMAGGHLGADRTYNAIKQFYYWPHLYADTYRYVKGCLACQTSKRAYHTHPPPLKSLPVVEVFDRLHIDYLGPLTKTPDGYSHILVVVDSSSKWVEAFPTRTQTAKETADILYREILTRYGAPRVIVSDRGKAFMSQLVKGLCELFSVKLAHTSPYKPSTNSAVERTNSSLLSSLRAYCNEDHSNWPDVLPGILMAYRATPSTQSTGYSPFFLMFGREMQRPIDVNLKPKDNLSREANTTLQGFLDNLQTCRDIAKENQAKQLEISKSRFDKKAREPVFKLGDMVLYKNNKKIIGKSPKLSPTWLGLYKIIEEGPNFTYKLENNTTKKTTSFINARHLQLFNDFQPSFQVNQQPDDSLDPVDPSTPSNAPALNDTFLADPDPDPDSDAASNTQQIQGPNPDPPQPDPVGPVPPTVAKSSKPTNPAPQSSPSLAPHPIVSVKSACHYNKQKWYKVKRHNLKGLHDVLEHEVPQELKDYFHANYNMQGRKKKSKKLKHFKKVDKEV